MIYEGRPSSFGRVSRNGVISILVTPHRCVRTWQPGFTCDLDIRRGPSVLSTW